MSLYALSCKYCSRVSDLVLGSLSRLDHTYVCIVFLVSVSNYIPTTDWTWTNVLQYFSLLVLEGAAKVSFSQTYLLKWV